MKARLAGRPHRGRLAAGLASAVLLVAPAARAQALSNGTFDVTIGPFGQIDALQLTGDAFPTNYVLNGKNGPAGFAASADHAWVGELMFKYRLGTGAWTAARTSQSDDVRAITPSAGAVTVRYHGSAHPQGIANFDLTETYSLVSNYLYWQISVTNTSAQPIEFGDFGLPLPFNEYWGGGDVIYEQRVVYHSFVGLDTSYVTVKRPSGIGPFLLLTVDPTTGAAFEYKDNWTAEEHPGSVWAEGRGPWPTGLEVYYVHSNVIKATNQGYLTSTSLTLAPGATKTYGFKFFKVADDAAVKATLHDQGLLDVTAVPGMMFSTDMTGRVDLNTNLSVDAVTPSQPAETTIAPVGPAAGDHHIYAVKFGHLGPNQLTVQYGGGKRTVLQFYVLEPIDAALQRHATFMVASTQAAAGDLAGVFDDWMMDTKARRGATGGWGWGDDWGWTHAEFLAEKNAQTPVASEVSALDVHLDAVWGRAVNPASFVVQDWWCPPGTNAQHVNGCFYDRAYAYPHAYNAFFSMYKVAHLYPTLVAYHHPADTYLLRAYDIVNALYSGPGDAGTGYMGEQTLPEIARALADAGHTAEASTVTGIVTRLHQAFQGKPYPYGSEYTYDNTGEEAVYTAARASGDLGVMGKVNAKTRACRGQEPVWYWYADPVTINGEAWWQFQYTAALAGYAMDDWTRNHSASPEVDERLAYAAKLANVSAINSGQIDPDPANLGTVAWTYQAMKGNAYRGNAEGGHLHGGWRQMAGEADLGLFGAIRILSADVAVDPIFGLYGYGCDVTEAGGCYAITPHDGVFKRLNVLTPRWHMEMDRDRYTGATVSKAGDYLGFTLENQMPAAAHTTTVTLTGFAPGTYPVSIDGVTVGTLTAVAGQPAAIALVIGTSATCAVRIGAGCGSSVAGPADGGAVSPGNTGGGSDGGADDGGEPTGSPAAGESGDAGSSGPSGVGAGGGGGIDAGVDRGEAGVVMPGGGGGQPVAEAGAGAAPGTGRGSGCGCSSVGGEGGAPLLARWAIAALALAARRRRSAPGRFGRR